MRVGSRFWQEEEAKYFTAKDFLLLIRSIQDWDIDVVLSDILGGERLLIQYTLDLRKPDLRKNLDLRKIVGATEFFST